MRVITGSARGAKLTTLEGMETRPTSERVKEGVFSALNFELPGARVLDLYAGSGQLGIEALSRGAKSCTFVDSSKAAVKVIDENVAKTGFLNVSKVVVYDSEQFAAHCREKYDIIICDPPYRNNTVDRLLPLVGEILEDGGMAVFESEKKYAPAEEYGSLKLQKRYHYGNTAIYIFRKGERK